MVSADFAFKTCSPPCLRFRRPSDRSDLNGR